MSATITNVYAKNEYSASAVSSHTCFVMAPGTNIYRQFNAPDGWTSIRLYFKVALYSDPLPSVADMTVTRFVFGVCSNNRSFGDAGVEHVAGYFWSNDSLFAHNWYVNGAPGGGGPTGTYNSNKTDPPNSAWEASAYVSRPFSYVTGSLKNEGGGSGGGPIVPFYQAAWGTTLTASNGYPLYNLSGYGWQTISVTFTKNSKSNATLITMDPRKHSALGQVNTLYNCGLNIPRSIVRRSMLTDAGAANFQDHETWHDWYHDLTKDNTSPIYTYDVDSGHRIDEATYGPLDCINFNWITNSGISMAIRDIVVVKIN